MKIKTAELIGKPLDWAVAVARCLSILALKRDGVHVDSGEEVPLTGSKISVHYTPSTDWQFGGPIIEREGISVGDPSHFDDYSSRQKYMAIKGFIEDDGGEVHGHGDTFLIAAMRCYVASKLGDEVDIPEELL